MITTTKHAIYGFLVLALATLAMSATAASLKTDADDIKPVFIRVSDGKQLDAVEATKAAIGGTRLLKCQEVEAKANSRTGNITLKKK